MKYKVEFTNVKPETLSPLIAMVLEDGGSVVSAEPIAGIAAEDVVKLAPKRRIPGTRQSGPRSLLRIAKERVQSSAVDALPNIVLRTLVEDGKLGEVMRREDITRIAEAVCARTGHSETSASTTVSQLIKHDAFERMGEACDR
jgi:hypothetical protein